MKESSNIAVIESGSKQYTISEGSIIDVEKLNAEVGSKVSLDNVLLYSDDKNTLVGQPKLSNVKISCEVLNQIKDKKKIVFKFKNKTGYKKKQGHRQQYTTLKVLSIKASSAKKQAKSED